MASLCRLTLDLYDRAQGWEWLQRLRGRHPSSSIKTMATLTIRNLTTTPVELKLVERFENAQREPSASANIARSFTGLMSSKDNAPSLAQIAQKAESFRNQDVSILIGAFETKATDIKPNVKEILRLTFEVDGQRYRIDTPIPSQRSTTLTPLSQDPRYEFTAVYHPKSSYLALFSSARLESWMSNLQNETPLCSLSIPGTHNSPTCYTALPSVRCQSVNIKEQLENGVRFLDIRVQPTNADKPSDDGLILVHSAFPISLTGNKYLRDLINVVLSFLAANPSETVLISLKREGVGKSTDQQVARILHDHYATDPARWFTDNRIPTLGEVRNKIVVIRRLNIGADMQAENDGKGWAIDASSWPDNCEDGMCSSGEIRVQDFYEVAERENIEKKITYSRNHLDRAGRCVCVLDPSTNDPAANPFFINFLSASNFWKANCWPDRIAAKVNPVIVEHLCINHNEADRGHVGDGGTGIVVSDWVGHNGDWDLVRCVVGHNAKLELKQW